MQAIPMDEDSPGGDLAEQLSSQKIFVFQLPSLSLHSYNMWYD